VLHPALPVHGRRAEASGIAFTVPGLDGTGGRKRSGPIGGSAKEFRELKRATGSFSTQRAGRVLTVTGVVSGARKAGENQVPAGEAAFNRNLRRLKDMDGTGPQKAFMELYGIG